jgi:hypothetical protein
MLKTERDTPTMGIRVLRAAKKKFGKRNIAVFFEHGHWNCRVSHNHDITDYSVLDAKGVGSIDGFDFEEI